MEKSGPRSIPSTGVVSLFVGDDIETTWFAARTWNVVAPAVPARPTAAPRPTAIPTTEERKDRPDDFQIIEKRRYRQ
jgi:hypothetical protein